MGVQVFIILQKTWTTVEKVHCVTHLSSHDCTKSVHLRDLLLLTLVKPLTVILVYTKDTDSGISPCLIIFNVQQRVKEAPLQQPLHS